MDHSTTACADLAHADLERAHDDGGTLVVHATTQRGDERTMRPATQDQHADRAVAPDEAPAGLRPGIRVLVVDDNQDAADMLASLLALLEADVRVAYDGPSALGLVDTFEPEAIVLDLGMPVMDGFEVARRVRASAHGDRIALAALSGWGQDRDRELTAAAGFDVHLVKPVDVDRVVSVLRGLDRKRRS